MRALKGELLDRNYGDAVRLEVADTCTDEMAHFLLSTFGLGSADLYRVHGPVNLHRMVAIHELAPRPDLKYPPFVPRVPRRIAQADQNLFAALRRGDILLHHPFDSFGPVVDLLRQAAADPDVLAIKQTLYRAGADSPVVDALIEAAQSGKEVTAVIELRARFDEAANINLATRLQKAGAAVVYGIVGYKAHAKMLLVVRREGKKLRRYVHLGTGNYHIRTARAYTDFGLLTSDRHLCEDVHRLFQQLTGLGKARALKRIVQSPFALQRTLVALIDAEAARARKGEPARIVAKMNALSEPGVIQALYRASRAGVEIDLIVRGLCCLRPGVPGVSDRIRVRSIVGRFLEHSRIFYFLNGGDELVWCASADWMQRNFYRRVEALFPIEDKRLAARAIAEGLELYLEDDVQSWTLGADGRYRRSRPGKERPRSAQDELLERLCERAEPAHAPEGLLSSARRREAKASEPGQKMRARRRPASPRARAWRQVAIEPHRPAAAEVAADAPDPEPRERKRA
jgi:polyphosphate kinase